MRHPKVILYGVSVRAWEVWQAGRPLCRGSLDACQKTHPDALPVSQHQLDLAKEAS